MPRGISTGIFSAAAASYRSALVAAQILHVLPHQELRSEIGDHGSTDLRHCDIDLAAENLQRLGRSRDAARRDAVERRPADEHELGVFAAISNNTGSPDDRVMVSSAPDAYGPANVPVGGILA